MTLLESIRVGVRAAEESGAFDPDQVSPGVIGFIVTGVFALAVIALGFDLVRRLRRSRYRAEIRADLSAELAARDAESSAATDTDLAGSGDQEPGADDEPRER